jgi:hypothetical protein
MLYYTPLSSRRFQNVIERSKNLRKKGPDNSSSVQKVLKGSRRFFKILGMVIIKYEFSFQFFSVLHMTGSSTKLSDIVLPYI